MESNLQSKITCQCARNKTIVVANGNSPRLLMLDPLDDTPIDTSNLPPNSSILTENIASINPSRKEEDFLLYEPVLIHENGHSLLTEKAIKEFASSLTTKMTCSFSRWLSGKPIDVTEETCSSTAKKIQSIIQDKLSSHILKYHKKLDSNVGVLPEIFSIGTYTPEDLKNNPIVIAEYQKNLKNEIARQQKAVNETSNTHFKIDSSWGCKDALTLGMFL